MIINRDFGHMMGFAGGSIVSVPLEEVAKGVRLVSLDNRLIRTARSLGTSFGD
jgi:6-phosphofructokinase 1